MSHEALANLFLALVAITPVCWAAVAIRRSSYTTAQACLFIAALLITRLLWRASLPRRVPVSRGQGAVIVCNHRSSVDPFFVQVCADRPIHWMVAREYCEHPAFRWFSKTCAVIPVNRGGIDTAATKAAMRLVANGEMVGMLPEGRINMSEQFMLPVRPGAVLVALKARVPILPCYIDGSPYDRTPWSPFLNSARVRIRFGQLMDMSPYYSKENDDGVVANLMQRVVTEIARLAGRSDFEPVLAGRRWKPTEDELEQAISERTARNRQPGTRQKTG